MTSADFFISRDFEGTKEYNFFLHPYEQEHIKKYRTLDVHDRDAVDWTLDHEHVRCTAPQPASLPETAEENQDLLYNVIPFRLADQPVSAGCGTYLGPEAFDTITVQANDLTRLALFGVPASGNSMEPEYQDGDVLIVERALELELGEIGVFNLDGEGYVKKLGKMELISLNPEYSPIPTDETIALNGRVIGVLNPEWIIKN